MSSFANFFLRNKSILSLRLESSISWNTRNFFRLCFFIFQAWKVPSWNIRSFFKKQFHFLKYKKNSFWENIRIFLILGLESFISQSIRKTFFWENIRHFLGWIFPFYYNYLSLGWKEAQAAPKSTTVARGGEIWFFRNPLNIGRERRLSCHKMFNPMKERLRENEWVAVNIFYDLQTANPFSFKFSCFS